MFICEYLYPLVLPNLYSFFSTFIVNLHSFSNHLSTLFFSLHLMARTKTNYLILFWSRLCRFLVRCQGKRSPLLKGWAQESFVDYQDSVFANLCFIWYIKHIDYFCQGPKQLLVFVILLLFCRKIRVWCHSEGSSLTEIIESWLFRSWALE